MTPGSARKLGWPSTVPSGVSAALLSRAKALFRGERPVASQRSPVMPSRSTLALWPASGLVFLARRFVIAFSLSRSTWFCLKD